MAAKDLEAKEILPLGAARVQPRNLAPGSAQAQEGVVFHRHLPIEVGNLAADLGDVTKEPSGQVDQVNALIEQLAAAGKGGIGAPFLFVAKSAAVAVARADVQQR